MPVVLAVALLVFGLLVGFTIGRVTAGDGTSNAAPLLTVSTTTAPPPGDTVPQDPGGVAGPTAPPSTDLPPVEFGTFENPVPAGQRWVLGAFTIEVVAVDRDATAQLLEYSDENEEPPAGQSHVLIRMRLTYSEDDGIAAPSFLQFFLTDGRVQYDGFESACGRIPDDLSLVLSMERNEPVDGHLCFTVPTADAERLVLATESFQTSLHFALPAG